MEIWKEFYFSKFYLKKIKIDANNTQSQQIHLSFHKLTIFSAELCLCQSQRKTSIYIEIQFSFILRQFLGTEDFYKFTVKENGLTLFSQMARFLTLRNSSIVLDFSHKNINFEIENLKLKLNFSHQYHLLKNKNKRLSAKMFKKNIEK